MSNPRQKNNTWKWVLLGLAALSALMGFFVYRAVMGSRDHLHGSLETLYQKGKRLDVEQCVEAVIAWRKGCQAASKLCDSFAPRAMSACLAPRDRSAYCRNAVGLEDKARFGFKECKARKLPKWTRKACYGAYEAVRAMCIRFQGKVPKPEHTRS